MLTTLFPMLVWMYLDKASFTSCFWSPLRENVPKAVMDAIQWDRLWHPFNGYIMKNS